MQRVKQVGAGVLLLLGFWCLGRAVETVFDPNPHRLEKRETVLAGLLLGVPATIGGVGLAVATYRHSQAEKTQHLRQAFFQVYHQFRGQITPMQLAEAAGISGAEAKAYLSEQARVYNGTFEVDEEGGLIFCFHAAEKPLESDY